MLRKLSLGSLSVSGVLLLTSLASAQQPVVFVHGFRGSSATWYTAATTLQSYMPIVTYRPNLGHGNYYSIQADQLRDYLYNMGLDSTALFVGHSNGGIVTRQMATIYPPKEIITVATPHRGARLALEVDNIQSLAGNIAMAGTYSFILIDPFNWWNYDVDEHAYDAYLWAGVAGSLLNWGVQTVLQNVINHADVLAEMYPESYGNSYLYMLNESGNLAHEATSVPWRYGYAYQFPSYYDAGIFSLVTSDPVAAVTYSADLAAAGLNLIVDGIWLMNEINYYSPDWIFAEMVVGSMIYLGYYGYTQSDYWCEKTGSVEQGVCFPNDGVVPTQNEYYPGAINAVVTGPNHMSATTSDTTIGNLAFALGQAMGLQ